MTFFLPFDDFRGPAVPTSPEGYVEYRQLAMRFIAARNERIASLGRLIGPPWTQDQKLAAIAAFASIGRYIATS